MEAEASGHAPEGVAYEVLRKQSTLLSGQSALLLKQSTLTGWEIADKRAGFALKVMTGLAGLITATALGVMVWEAAHDKSMVVTAFRAPPAYAARGLSGEAVAERFVDRFADIRRKASVSLMASSDVRESGDEIRVEIPQTGVSLGEIQRLLQRWLGHQTVISGSLVEDEPGLVTLTARLAGRGAVTISGPAADLDALMQTLAERAFNVADPINSGIYLLNNGRPDEALATARENARNYDLSARDVPKASLVGIWALAEGDPARQVAVAQSALALDAKLMSVHRILGQEYLRLGHEQDAWETYARALTLKSRDQPQGYRANGVPRMLREFRYSRAVLAGDFVEAARASDFSINSSGGPQQRALAAAHQTSAAMGRLNRERDEQTTGASDGLFTEASIRDAAGDWAGVIEALRAHETARDAIISPPASGLGPSAGPSPVRVALRDAQRLRRDAPLMARAMAWSGDVEGARSLLAPTPMDCAPCLRARGEVEWAARNWSAAEAWLAKADAATPSLPQAQLLMAKSRLARGDLDRAISAAAEAHRRSPRFADPLEVWGEALLAKGQASAAEGKFVEAAKLTPRWGRLHLKWGEALANLGKQTDAQAQWRTAATLDLTTEERAQLQAVTQKRTN